MAYRNHEHLQSILACPCCGGQFDWRVASGHCLQCGSSVSKPDGAFIFHTEELPDNFKHPEYTSGNPYHSDCLALIEKYETGAVLNYGAGNPRFPFENVIELEIRQYPNTDLVVASDRLPLTDHSVDGVISLSVLEHVKDPFRYVAEIYRVLKPGGTCVLHAAFMQPFHAYPDHYFNATKPGLLELFQNFEVENIGIGDHQHPWIMLNWILNAYLQGLDERSRQWLKQQTIGGLLAHFGGLAAARNAVKTLDDPYRIAAGLGNFNRDHAAELDPLTQLHARALESLAAGFALMAKKPLR